MLQGLAVALCRLVSVLFLPPLNGWQAGKEAPRVSQLVTVHAVLTFCVLSTVIGASSSVESENDRFVCHLIIHVDIGNSLCNGKKNHIGTTIAYSTRLLEYRSLRILC